MKLINAFDSPDLTKKFVFELEDGFRIESVLIFHKRTVCACLSTQVGCPVGCKFCATGRMGFHRNLTVDEIVGQFNVMNNFKQITNIVFMGMGEPLLNFDNVVEAINYFRSLEVSWRKITVSTVGIPDRIKELAKKVQCKLTLSLHAPDDALRSELVPINSRFLIKEFVSALKYVPIRKKNPLVVACTLIKGVNDFVSHAEKLVSLPKQLSFVDVNLC